MTIRALRRMVEAFFRLWPIYVLILVGSLIFGVVTVSRTPQTYTASGTVFVDNQTLVTTQSGVGGAAFSFLSPAQFTSQEMIGLVQTDIFLASVVERADVDLPAGPVAILETTAEPGETDDGATSDDGETDDGETPEADEAESEAEGSDTIERSSAAYALAEVEPPPDPAAWSEESQLLRQSISVFPIGENLVSVNVSTETPELSFRLAVALIEEYVQFQIAVDIAESAASEEFFSDLAGNYKTDVNDSREEIDEALSRVEQREDLTLQQELQLDRLKEAEVLAVTRFQAAADDVEVSRLAMLQAQTDVRQSYSIFDPPQQPTQPDGSLFDNLSLIAVSGAVGLGLALMLPILIGLLGRGVQFADDLDKIAPVIGVVPKLGRGLTRLDGKRHPIDPEMSPEEQVIQAATETRTYHTMEIESVAKHKLQSDPLEEAVESRQRADAEAKATAAAASAAAQSPPGGPAPARSTPHPPPANAEARASARPGGNEVNQDAVTTQSFDLVQILDSSDQGEQGAEMDADDVLRELMESDEDRAGLDGTETIEPVGFVVKDKDQRSQADG